MRESVHIAQHQDQILANELEFLVELGLAALLIEPLAVPVERPDFPIHQLVPGAPQSEDLRRGGETVQELSPAERPSFQRGQRGKNSTGRTPMAVFVSRYESTMSKKLLIETNPYLKDPARPGQDSPRPHSMRVATIAAIGR